MGAERLGHEAKEIGSWLLIEKRKKAGGKMCKPKGYV